jgi:hypothetical protein
MTDKLIHAPAQHLQLNPLALIQQAIEKGMSGEQLNGLLDFARNVKAEAAKEAYFIAFRQFKETAPAIIKTAEIKHGEKLIGTYARLEDVCDALIPALLKVGITHRWTSVTSSTGIVVTCYLRHEMGYEEEGASLPGAPDNGPARNAVQAMGSTMKYLQRYTLLASCGVTTKGIADVDDGPKMPEETLLEWIDAVNQAPNLGALKETFKGAWSAAKAIGDMGAQKKLTDAYEGMKRELA